MFEPRDIENPIAEQDFRNQSRKDRLKKEKDDVWDLIAKLFDGAGREDE
jgi:hypothetical protein